MDNASVKWKKEYLWNVDLSLITWRPSFEQNFFTLEEISPSTSGHVAGTARGCPGTKAVWAQMCAHQLVLIAAAPGADTLSHRHSRCTHVARRHRESVLYAYARAQGVSG